MNYSYDQRHIREDKSAVRTQYLSLILFLIHYLPVVHYSTLYDRRPLKVYLNTLRGKITVS